MTLEKETEYTLELVNTPSGQTLIQRWNNGDVLHVHILGEEWEEGEPDA